MSTADLRLVLLLLLVVGTFLIFTTCNDAPVAPSSAGIRPAPGGVPGPNPDRPGGGGNKGNKGGQVDGNFSLRFDGTDDGMETPDTDALDLTSTFTIEAWIKPTNPARGEPQCIVCKWGLSVSASYGIAFEGHDRLMMVTHDPTPDPGNPDNTKIYSTSGVFLPDVWRHVAFVFDEGQAWLYVDGVLNSSCGRDLGNCWDQNINQTVPYLNTPQITSTKLSIGRQNSPEGFVDHQFDGVMDEVRIWNVARSAKKIDQNKDKEISPKAKGLVAYWKMNEGRGQVLVDATGNGHDMQLGDSPDADAADPTWALKWESLASLPVPVRASAAETDASHAFVFAGAQNVNDEVNDTQIYDVATDSWSHGTARDPVKAFNMGAAMSDGIHVVGGFNTAHLDIHDVYDPANDTWSTRAAMPIATHAGTAQAVDEKLYVMTGGQSGANPINQIFDAATNSWSAGTARPLQGGTFASAVIDGLIYVTGGQAAGGTVTHDELHRYDPDTDSWQQLASLPGERSALGGGAISGQFCVFGGRTANPSPTGARFAETFCYDPTTDWWSRGPDMITPRAEMASAELGNTIYALGGRPTNDALHSNFAERLVPDTPFR